LRHRSAIAGTSEEASLTNAPALTADETRCPLCDRNHHDHSSPRGTGVLVVEDDASIAELIAYNLERSGHRVIIAADGVEALRRLRQSAPDLVVLDLLLPLRSGWQVLREMRGGPAHLATVPVLLVTALACERLAADLPRLGAQGLLGKPFAVADLCQTVRELVDAHRGAAAAPS
jgi:DNA-binding response OmpR family regulator